ncbi:MAG: DUF177 domain-containing protein [Coprobacillus sp.]|nr:DUF177 domain-containing protein [Coprobacillus sp.]
MKINFYTYKENEKERVSYDPSFKSEQFDPVHILGVRSCHADVDVTKVGELLYLTVSVKFVALAPCSYTLEEVEYHGKEKEDFIFSFNGNEEEGIDTIEKNGDINLDDVIHSIIVATVPFHLHKPGASLPQGGKGYRVLTEDELEKEREEDKSSPFDVLDNLDL